MSLLNPHLFAISLSNVSTELISSDKYIQGTFRSSRLFTNFKANTDLPIEVDAARAVIAPG